VGDCVSRALDMDLHAIGKPALQPDAAAFSGQLENTIVLQVVKARNLCLSSEQEDSRVGDRVLRLHLSDGHTKCPALELVRHPQLRSDLLPGTKVPK
jgi:tudor domain-containing protein 3